MSIGLIGNKGDRMNKVFINKDTDMVEQIFEVKTIDELPDDYFSNCYSVIDEEGKINAYNLKYNKATKIFEVIEGMPPKYEVIVIKQPTLEDIKNLRKENVRLNQEKFNLEERIKNIEEVLNIKYK